MTGNPAEQEKKLMSKLLVVAFAALSILATAIPADAGCNPYCRQVPNGAGGTVTVCTCM